MQPHELKLPHGQPLPGAIGHGRGVVKPNYAFFPPGGVLKSRVPQYDRTVVRFLAAPVLGAQFAQFILEMEAGGGTPAPFADPGVSTFFYCLSGTAELAVEGGPSGSFGAGSYAYVPPGVPFTLKTAGEARVLGLRKRFESCGQPTPAAILSHKDKVAKVNHSGFEGRGFQFLLGESDPRFDFEMNLMWFQPGAYFPDVETHIMEHGLYMLEGQGLYLLGQDWHEIWAGDFIWMGGYCPQQFYPTGFGEACYLLYKNVNRDVPL